MIAIGFDEPEFREAIQRELSALRGLGLIRLVDALFVAKDDFGGLTRMEMSDLTESEKMEFGALIGGMIGMGAGDWEGAEIGLEFGAEMGALAASRNVFGVSGEEMSAFLAAELIEEEAIDDVVDTLVAADMIEEEAAAAILAADDIEDAA